MLARECTSLTGREYTGLNKFSLASERARSAEREHSRDRCGNMLIRIQLNLFTAISHEIDKITRRKRFRGLVSGRRVPLFEYAALIQFIRRIDTHLSLPPPRAITIITNHQSCVSRGGEHTAAILFLLNCVSRRGAVSLKNFGIQVKTALPPLCIGIAKSRANEQLTHSKRPSHEVCI